MRVTFVALGSEQLGVSQLSAIAKREGHEVGLAFSALTGTYRWMLGVAAEAKALLPSAQIVFGGVHPSAVPDRVLAHPFVDYVCVGEGDVALPAILRAVGQGGPSAPLPNTRHRAPDGSIVRGPQNGFLQDLDSLPFFDKQPWEEQIRIGDFYPTMASRGCPDRCTCCFNSFSPAFPTRRAASTGGSAASST